jgi:hypothetical protein
LEELNMLSENLLKKMKQGVVAAAVCGGVVLGAEKSDPPVAQAVAEPLSAEKREAFAKHLADYLGKDTQKSGEAFTAIVKLGPGVAPLLNAELEKATDVNVKRQLGMLIRWVKAGGDPCPPCGMG